MKAVQLKIMGAKRAHDHYRLANRGILPVDGSPQLFKVWGEGDKRGALKEGASARLIRQAIERALAEAHRHPAPAR